MYSFRDDYSEGAHPNILKALIQTNEEQMHGYGHDPHTERAIGHIRRHVKDETVDVHLLAGGTQTNLIAISSFLRPHEACITVETGHIVGHETGAIENTGHKVLTVPSEDGKIKPSQVQQVLKAHSSEHAVKPKLVYISNSTELGTVYSKDELRDLHAMCQNHDLYLYMDGARLGAALVVDEAKLRLADICQYTDAFFIGGTKNGALLGEALVVRREELKADLRYLIKQKGALMAKGRVLGVQFEALFADDLYMKLANHARKMADRIREGIEEAGFELLSGSPTNQIFLIVPNAKLAGLMEQFDFHIWSEMEDRRAAIRLVTSWATTNDAVEALISCLKGR